MTASSQTLPGALPPEQPSVQRPIPLSQALAATASEAAAAVIDATMAETGGATGEELAAAEQRAGLLFDAAHVEAAVSAAREQAHAEGQAELAQLGEELAEARQQLALMAGVRRQLAAVLRLCEGRRGDDLLLVSAVAVAAETSRTALDGLPMTLTWKRSAQLPLATDLLKRAVVECESSYGGRADLVIDGDDRRALASLLDSEIVLDIHAPCPHSQQCGTAEDLDASDPELFGWTRVEVAGIEGVPRWYCTPQCVSNALARAGEELTVIDQMANDMIAVDRAEHPGEYADEQHPHGDPLAYGPTGIPCGCGKPAHSSLVPCQPDTAADVDQPAAAPVDEDAADQAVRRSVDAQFPVVAAFLADDDQAGTVQPEGDDQ
ncbi:hypothetical protein [Streptomyces albogriseolus]|uniref:hypothetical protein n=1 Tax=Streptomyces albogriseolus TaxID=1887 RepID=UPI003CEFC2FD